MARAKGATAVLLLSLALGTGVNAAVFGVLDALLLGAPAGVEDASRLVSIYTSEFSGATYGQSSYPDFESVKSSATSFAAIAAVDDNAVENVRLGEFSQSARIAAVSEDYLPRAADARAPRPTALASRRTAESSRCRRQLPAVGTTRRRRRDCGKDDHDWRPAVLGRWRHDAALSRPSGRARVRRVDSDDRVQPRARRSAALDCRQAEPRGQPSRRQKTICAASPTIWRRSIQPRIAAASFRQMRHGG